MRRDQVHRRAECGARELDMYEKYKKNEWMKKGWLRTMDEADVYVSNEKGRIEVWNVLNDMMRGEDCR